MSQFPEFETEYGPPASCIAPREEIIRSYEGRLPPELLALWREDGWCSYGGGLLWLVDPAQFDGIPEDWGLVGDTTPLVFLRSAFAHLYLWHEGQVLSLDVHRGSVSQVTSRIGLMFSLLCDAEIKERILRASLFQQALASLGPITREECYAFEPALALGGPGTLDTIRRVEIREHLGILAQLVA